MLFWRGVFWALFATFTAAVLLWPVAVYETFGLPAMYAAIFLLFLLYLWTERRKPVYFDDGDLFMLGGDSRPVLPPPGERALPPPGPRQITRSQRSALPGAERIMVQCLR
jgi:hypothetical protein